MNSESSLPVILVSACDVPTAETFISELIDNEVSEMDREQGGQTSDERARVWRLVNKYYHADVAVLAHADAGNAVEAHVLYLTPQECDAGAAAAESAAHAGLDASVRVLALKAVRVPAALAAWARRARYEPVALLEPAPAPGPFAEAAGVARVRAALHAHPWPGLRRHDRAAPPPEYDLSSSSGGEEDVEAEGEEEGEAAAVERAEQFARALGALGEEGRAGGAAGDAERRARAEQLVAAFCRALGHDLDAC